MMIKNLFILATILSNCFSYSQNIITIKKDLSDLQTQLNKAIAGDTFIIPNGTYSDGLFAVISKSGTVNDLITIKSETPGGVIFADKVGFVLSGNYIKFSGFLFDESMVHEKSPIADEPTVLTIIGSHNIIENVKMLRINQNPDIINKKGKVSPCRYVMFRNQNAKNNIVRNCWFEKGKEHSIVVIGYINKGMSSTKNMIEGCYFKGPFRHPKNGNSAVRFGAGERNFNPIGGNIVRNNLFDEYNGEEETISLKSSENIIEHNTFLNCYGQVNSRHYHNNTIKHNYFIRNQTPKDNHNGGAIGIWGENHIVSNNYFSGVKSRDKDGGTIELLSGNSEELKAKHERVNHVIINNNIIYQPHINDAAIAFSARAQNIKSGKTDKTGAFITDRELYPINITISDNYIYASTDNHQKMIDYNGFKKTEKSIKYSGNKINKNTGDSGLDSERFELFPQEINGYTIYRTSAVNIGPNKAPLNTSLVGPLWTR